MAKVTSKLQVTIPKAIADRYAIEPGREIEFLPAGEAIRVVVGAGPRGIPDRLQRLLVFDRASERQLGRQRDARMESTDGDRGWQREELYGRGIAD
jgi:bifunctional DNA-binding transcriptional regulator/antitoxin component of YhaV-PrlF toxin-antitoxin module